MSPRPRVTPAHRSLIAGLPATLLWLIGAAPALGVEAVPSGAREALAPVTRMIGTLVAIAIGLGIAVCTAVIVWGGIEKMLAGPNSDAEHKASRRISNGIMGLVWMSAASSRFPRTPSATSRSRSG